jgi:hypothetical protein
MRITTLNVRDPADGFDERLPLILADRAALRPDL